MADRDLRTAPRVTDAEKAAARLAVSRASGDGWAYELLAALANVSDLVPDGTAALTQLGWNESTGAWEALEAPRNTFNNYPWFVLTQDDDADQVVEAIEYFLANRDSQGNVDFSGQPFRVTGGVRYPGQFQDYTDMPSIGDVWPEAGPAAWWWALAAAVGDREEGYWIRYRTWNRARFNIRIAVHTTDAPAAGDWGASFASSAQQPFNLPVFTVDSRISIWMDEDNPIQEYYEGDEASDGRDSTLDQAQDAEAPLTLDGVDGFYRAGNATLPVATHSGVERSIYPQHVTDTDEWDQPHPTFGTAGFRVGGTVYDWAKGQIVGDRPDDTDQRAPNTSTPWSALWLLYTAPAPAASTVETITTQARSLRFPPPVMYYGWAARETRGEVEKIDLGDLGQSQTLEAIMPRHSGPSAYFVCWVAETAMQGHTLLKIQLGPDMLDCETVAHDAPDGRAGRLCVGGGSVPVSGRVGQVLTVTPADAE